MPLIVIVKALQGLSTRRSPKQHQDLTRSDDSATSGNSCQDDVKSPRAQDFRKFRRPRTWPEWAMLFWEKD
jgi:hypothetical protein